MTYIHLRGCKIIVTKLSNREIQDLCLHNREFITVKDENMGSVDIYKSNILFLRGCKENGD